MGEEIDMAIIKRTQDSLGRYIKKPPLTEKLLRKPPFRFLHDILTNVIHSTGYMKHLYSSDELNAENIKDKENKIKFLQKAIDVVVFTTGENLSIRPNKVVAGQEADRTNIFLQTLASAIPNKEKGIEAVQRVKNGEKTSKPSKRTDSSKRTSQEETKSKSEAKEKSGSRSRSQETVSNKKEKATKDSASRDSKSKSSSKSGNKEKSRSNRISSRNENNAKEDNIRKSSHKGDEPLENKLVKPDLDENQVPVNGLKQIEENGHMVNGDSSLHNEQSLNVPKKVNSEGDTPVVRPSTTRPLSGRPMKSSSRPPTSSVRRSHAKGSGSIVQMTSTEQTNRPVTSIGRLKTARPSSARPPPPVVRSKRTVVEETASPEVSNTVANVIVDNENDAEDDDNAFIMEEAAVKLPVEDEPVASTSSDPNLKLDDKQHGSLVSQILETKKDLEMDNENLLGNKRVEIDKSEMSEAMKRKEKDLVTREIEKMRSCIQLLTRGVNPLGKMIDYLQEDVDSMQNDLEKWQRENQTYVQSLKQEQSSLETSIEPLKVQLEELDLAIQDQMEKISRVKANILRNEEKIKKLLATGKH